MSDNFFRMLQLRRMPFALSLAVTFLIVILGGGYLAAVVHMVHHYENKDEKEGLTLDDLECSFHGMHQEAILIGALKGSMRENVSDEEFAVLLEWLEGDKISETYDAEVYDDEGNMMPVPADIIYDNCRRCHGRSAKEGDGINETVPLEYWDEVKQFAFSKDFDPVPLEILYATTHTHALSMAMITVVSSLLLLASGWPRRLRDFIVLLTFAALLVDLGSWWLAREWAAFCPVIAVSGGIYGGLLSIQLIAAFLDIWIGRFLPSKEKV